MSALELLWNEYRYFPYEEHLARDEAARLFGAKLVKSNGHVAVDLSGDTETDPLSAARRLTYFAEVRLPDGSVVIPDQTRLERGAFNSVKGRSSIPSRQITRYSAHGLHEYRGKFNPQVVRAIGNLCLLGDGAWVIDPFCGSGTTLLESSHIGWNAIGLDRNPLAVVIANAKITAARLPAGLLREEARRLSDRLQTVADGLDCSRPFSDDSADRIGGDAQGHLFNREYLNSWFSKSVLAQLSLILRELQQVSSTDLRLVFKVVLSDILRRVSLQDTADLRVRRAKSPPGNHPAILTFCRELLTKAELIESAKEVAPAGGLQEAHVADARDELTWIRRRHGIRGVDAVITSPPYATALPYIDTQRLSLALFGLTLASSLSRLQESLIGTRELRKTRQRSLESSLRANGGSLPRHALEFCQSLGEVAFQESDGFRRRNTPALVYQYLTDMSRALRNLFDIVRPNGHMAMVVGRNKAELGGRSIVIDTPALLAEIAQSHGWLAEEERELDTYARFDLHRENSIKTESLLIFKKPGQRSTARNRTGGVDARP
ncbi:MAG: hypothetical protein Q7T33_12945 [Dehalococcoidia bacterium]|nr:hypothetical protein [Dehalococcoidia bacterium]